MCLVLESALANGGISRHDPSSSLKTICVVELLGCFASFGKHRPELAARSQVSRMNLEQNPDGPTTADLWELTHHESIGAPALWCWGVWQEKAVQFPQLPWPVTFNHDLFLSVFGLSHHVTGLSVWSSHHYLEPQSLPPERDRVSIFFFRVEDCSLLQLTWTHFLV